MIRRALRVSLVSLVLLAMLATACARAEAPPAPTTAPIRARNSAATTQEIEAKLQRLNALISTRDKAIDAEFTTDADTLLIGSEASKLAVGREQLSAFFDALFKQPATVSWDWTDTRISSIGDVAWVYVSGDIVSKGPDDERRSPYRMTGVLERRDGQWLWRQFHGSEPVAPAPPATR